MDPCLQQNLLHDILIRIIFLFLSSAKDKRVGTETGTMTGIRTGTRPITRTSTRFATGPYPGPGTGSGFGPVFNRGFSPDSGLRFDSGSCPSTLRACKKM